MIKTCKNCNKILTKKQILKKGEFCCKGCATSFRQKAFDPNVFKNEDKDLVFYILGLIWSDGNLNKDLNKISLTLKDLDLIQTLYPHFSDINKRKIYSYNKNGFESHTIINTNKDFIKKLMEYGLIPCKSYDITFPNIPQSFFYSFIRGVFDGDGSVYIQNRYKNIKYLGVSIISANKMFLIPIQEILKTKKIDSNIIKDSRGSVYCLKIYRKESIKNFFNYIYKDSKYFLHRKKNVFIINDIV